MTKNERLQKLEEVRGAFEQIWNNALSPVNYRKKHHQAITASVAGVKPQVDALIEAEKACIKDAIQSLRVEKMEHMLVPSSTPGRYSLDSADGPDITTGQPLEIRVCGQWISGVVQHAGHACVSQCGVSAAYFFECANGDSIGLCVGMLVRL